MKFNSMTSSQPVRFQRSSDTVMKILISLTHTNAYTHSHFIDTDTLVTQNK